ncbi:MerR family DNA-binding protein [Allosaccharopolyspora coralli]|uniref:MerR family DNA-binding protein n=1 Tax=Allosaccharopolyspora coralli TaxID=2665642 RepID=A0A5Q3Q957_9PSEU|nr:MerR family DNA-binding protein [Allosaccharopolyspora coralli]QGK69956.1 MerR family DNA-binding protein [Allosaccharopolyspora coralli]
MSSPTFTAGQAARQAGLSRKAMRVYEAKGLVGEPRRSPAGYRLFTAEDVATLGFVRQARTLGLRLDDIAEILTLHRDGATPCPSVRHLLDQRITEIDTAIADLTALRASLTRARDTEPAQEASEPEAVCSLVERTASGCQPGVDDAAPPGRGR